MKYIIDTNINQLKNTVITLGKFDGLHIGHQKLISIVCELSVKHNLEAVVFSFFPLPAAVKSNEPYKGIYSANEKKTLLEMMGVDIYIEYPFGKIMHMPPQMFVEEILYRKLRCKFLAVGEDFRFGKDRAGDVDLLNGICHAFGITVVVMPDEEAGQAMISSSRIRSLISGHSFKEAEILLGRPYFISGIVEQGKKLGRAINFPTANILIPDDKFLPDDGVYITKTIYNGTHYPSVTNIGKNPTFGGGARKCESYLFDFDKDIYGENITVNFYEFIRGEKKFESVEALKAQISEDSARAEMMFH